jgi:hypothetical protein
LKSCASEVSNSSREEDESNLINKEDFNENKVNIIITARATPVKTNALAKKNLSTARKGVMSPSFSNNTPNY